MALLIATESIALPSPCAPYLRTSNPLTPAPTAACGDANTARAPAPKERSDPPAKNPLATRKKSRLPLDSRPITFLLAADYKPDNFRTQQECGEIQYVVSGNKTVVGKCRRRRGTQGRKSRLIRDAVLLQLATLWRPPADAKERTQIVVG